MSSAGLSVAPPPDSTHAPTLGLAALYGLATAITRNYRRLPSVADEQAAVTLGDLERALTARGRDVALFMAYDLAPVLEERPGLKRAYFAQRSVTDEQLTQILAAFRAIEGYVEVFESEKPLLEALASGRLQALQRDLKIIYNGIESGVVPGGFAPGRKSLIPAVADTYGIPCAHSSAYACGLALHKFHFALVLRATGVRVPRVWHFRSGHGWVGERPPRGIKVIAKSTYEAWSVGVTDDSVFVVDDEVDARVGAIAEAIGQPSTVQEFVAGDEVYVPVYAVPAKVTTPPVEVVLTKAPKDPQAVMTMHDNVLADAVHYRRYSAPEPVLQQLRAAAIATFDALQLQAFARVDFRVDAEGRPWVIDVGCSPGMSTAGAAFHSLGLLGFNHPRFLRTVIAATPASRGLLVPVTATTRSQAF